MAFNSFRFVTIAMEAMDQLLVACHSQSLNLFVESFLKMVQKLLECADPDVQCLATVSVSQWMQILSFSRMIVLSLCWSCYKIFVCVHQS